MYQQIIDEAAAAGKTLDPVSVAFTLGFISGYKGDDAEQKTADPTNTALIFIKPHANNAKVQALVKKELEAGGFKITYERDVPAEEIKKGALAAKHYYAIASKAGYVPSFKSPQDLNIPKDKFKDKFGLDYDETLAAGKVFSGAAAAEYLGLSNAELDDINFAAKKAKDFIKFGGGFYCGKLADTKSGEGHIYVINAFCGNMLDAYVADTSAGVHLYRIEWPESSLSWEDFRAKKLGPTDPADAPKDSLRGLVLANYKELGLTSKPNGGLNGVHGSASPFEAMSEIENWCGVALKEQSFYQDLTAAGVTADQINSWKYEAQIFLDASKGKKGSSFDVVEDTDRTDCIATLAKLAKFN